jgi:hypothetical protein
MRNIVIVCSIIIASLLSFPAFAQQKTVRACQEEWRANRAENQAKGITLKAYVDQCRTTGTTAQPATPPASQPSRTTTGATRAPGQKTIRACQEEWRANRAENQAKGITLKAYVDQCRAGATTAQPAPTVSRPRATTGATPTAPQAPARRAPSVTATPMGANQYASEAQAQRRCGTGTVVWANLDSNIYHFSTYKDYGSTKSGAYMCERDATSQGMRAAKNEKHP